MLIVGYATSDVFLTRDQKTIIGPRREWLRKNTRPFESGFPQSYLPKWSTLQRKIRTDLQPARLTGPCCRAVWFQRPRARGCRYGRRIGHALPTASTTLIHERHQL